MLTFPLALARVRAAMRKARFPTDNQSATPPQASAVRLSFLRRILGLRASRGTKALLCLWLDGRELPKPLGELTESEALRLLGAMPMLVRRTNANAA